MSRQVVLAPGAEADLDTLHDYIADRAGLIRAKGYIDRILATCDALADYPERGRRRDDLREGLRVIGFERRVSIAFHIEPDRVVIDRVLYGGRDLPSAFDNA